MVDPAQCAGPNRYRGCNRSAYNRPGRIGVPMNVKVNAATAAPRVSMRERMAMYNDNALKIGLFGSNCSSGRAVTLVPERWTGNWEDNLALAKMCGRSRHRVHAAGRALEGLRRRHRLHGHDAGDHHLGDGASRQHQALDRVRHRACAAVPSADRGQAIRHRRSGERGPLWIEHRGRLERGRVPDVRRHAARPRAALRLRPGMARGGEDGLGAAGGFRLRRQIHQAQEGAGEAQALRRHAPADHERRRLADRPRLRDPQLRRLLHAGRSHVDGRNRKDA